MRRKNNARKSKLPIVLGRVYLWSMFLQQFVWYLYKAESVWCGYSTRVGDNVVEMTNKRCPSGSPKSVLLFVAPFFKGTTLNTKKRRDQNAFRLNKIKTRKINTPYDYGRFFYFICKAKNFSVGWCRSYSKRNLHGS